MKYDKIFKWLLVILFVLGLAVMAFCLVKSPSHDEWALAVKDLKVFQGDAESMDAAFAKAEENLANDQKALEEEQNNLVALIEELAQTGIISVAGVDVKADPMAAAKTAVENAQKPVKALNDSLANKANKFTNSQKKALEAQIANLNKELKPVDQLIDQYNIVKMTKESVEGQAEYLATTKATESNLGKMEKPIDSILGFAGITILISLIAVILGVFVIGGINNPKSLLKLFLGIVVVVGVIIAAYFLAKGGRPAALPETVMVSDGQLKLTDTMLNLTYLLVGGSLLSLVVAWIVGAINK